MEGPTEPRMQILVGSPAHLRRTDSPLLGLKEEESPEISLEEGQRSLEEGQRRMMLHLAQYLPKPPSQIWLAGPGSKTAAELLEATGFSTLSEGSAKTSVDPDYSTLASHRPGGALLFGDFSTLSSPQRPEASSKRHEARSKRPEDMEARRQLLTALSLAMEPGGSLVLLDIHHGLDTRSSRAALEVILAESGFSIRKTEDVTERVTWCVPLLATPGSKPADSSSGSETDPFTSRLSNLSAGKARCHLLVCQLTEFRIRDYRSGDEEKILELFAQCFHQRRSQQHWRWQYLAAPGGGPKVSLAVEGNGQLAGQYAGYPVSFFRYREGQRETLASHQIGDTMTRPDIRHIGRGPTSLLCRTARHFFSRHCQGQVAFNYGFNVGNIQRFSMRFLGARRVMPVAFWRRSSEGLVAKPSLSDHWLRKIKIQSVDQPDARWDEFFERVAPQYGFLAQRTAEQLQWRFLTRPDFSYFVLAAIKGKKLCGWSVFRRQEQTLVWGDCLFDRQHLDLLPMLLTTALENSWAEGVTHIEGWFSDRTEWFAQELCRLGFEQHPEPNGLALMCLPFAAEDPTEAMRQDLYYTLGDSDLF